MADTTNVKITVKSAHKILRSRNLKSTPSLGRECYHFHNVSFGYNPLMNKYCGKTWERNTNNLRRWNYRIWH